MSLKQKISILEPFEVCHTVGEKPIVTVKLDDVLAEISALEQQIREMAYYVEAGTEVIFVKRKEVLALLNETTEQEKDLEK